MALFITLGLLFIGFIIFLALTKQNITLPIPAEERLDAKSIQLIVEAYNTTHEK